MKKFAVALTAVLALGTLSACGGGEADAFCDDMKDFAKDSASAATDPAGTAKKFKDIEAPSEIKDEWKTYTDALSAIAEDPAKAADQLTELTDATSKITTYVTDNC